MLSCGKVGTRGRLWRRGWLDLFPAVKEGGAADELGERRRLGRDGWLDRLVALALWRIKGGLAIGCGDGVEDGEVIAEVERVLDG